MKSTSIYGSYKVLILVAFSTLGAFSPIQAHEPIFGLGPRTIWLHGFGLEGQLEIQRYTRQALYELEYEGLYGVTPNWSVTVSVAQTLNGPASEGFSFGNVGVRTKYRFYRRDVQGGVYQATAIGGIQLPTRSDEMRHAPPMPLRGCRPIMKAAGGSRLPPPGTGSTPITTMSNVAMLFCTT